MTAPLSALAQAFRDAAEVEVTFRIERDRTKELDRRITVGLLLDEAMCASDAAWKRWDAATRAGAEK